MEEKQRENLQEEAVATFRCAGQELRAEVTRDPEKGLLHFTLTGTPTNLQEHRGLHVQLLAYLVENMTDGGRGVLSSSCENR